MAKLFSNLCQQCFVPSFQDLDGADNERLHPKHDRTSAEYVPPDMWGLNIKDIDHFKGQVDETFANYKCSEDDPHYRAAYNHELVGPSVYTVTQGLIRREAERTNGLSWALMRHEDGLQCLGFASHAWVEGIYEFIRKIRRRWPRGVAGMYICFLSNPQIGVKSLLGLTIEDSPFHMALSKATHVVVVPNRIESIYTRLWCAYEVYFAMQRAETSELSIVLAFGTPTTFLVVETIFGMLITLGGTIFSYLVLAPRIGKLQGPVMWLATSFFLCLCLSIVGRHLLKMVAHSKILAKTDADGEKWNFRTQLFLVYLELFIWALGSGCAMRHLMRAIADRWELDLELVEDDAQFVPVSRRGAMTKLISMRHSLFYFRYFEAGEEVPCLLLAIGMISVFLQHIFLVLMRKVIRQESHMLEFKGLRHATAAKRADEEKLRRAIDADLESVENLIDMLRGIGRYNAEIRSNVRRGLGWKQARDGESMLGKALTAIIAWEFWWMADLSGRAHVGFVLCFATLTCILVVFLLHKFGDTAIFAVEVNFWMSLSFVIVSNWTLFWKEEFVEGLKMSVSTCLLQILMIALTVFLCYLFYSERLRPYFKKVHVWKGHVREHSMDLLTRRRSSLIYEELPTSNVDTGSSARTVATYAS